MDTALSAIQAYQAAAKKAASGAASAGTEAASSGQLPHFGRLMQDEIGGVQSQLKSAEGAAAAGIMGQAPLIDVTTAITSAELSLETMVAVRDQVIAAYQEIMRMPV